jgi:hypothetical protein
MTIGQFCRYSGLSRWHFRSLADRHHLRFVEKGRAKLVDVEQAMSLVPRIMLDQQIPDRRFELVERLKAALADDETAGSEPLDAA